MNHPHQVALATAVTAALALTAPPAAGAQSAAAPEPRHARRRGTYSGIIAGLDRVARAASPRLPRPAC
ncbi:hypothetical protein ACFWBF_32720 [Streptomyces sp. NPDC060028]|uniref:hypothetical protein n=1 Tax=Streptomyces sp. NPDC060028 TaxID=3347041 RepID=UPI0036BC9AC4